MSEKGKVLSRLIISIIVIGILVLTAYFLLKHFNLLDIKRETIQDFVNSYGALAPIIFIIVTFLQVTFIPIPSTVTIVAGNYLFGFWQSYLYSYIGLLLGSAFAFFLGRVLGKPFVSWIAGGKDKFESYEARLKGRENVFLFFAFLLPFFPDDFLCSLAGITKMNFLSFMIMQVFCRFIAIGGNLLFLSGEVIKYQGFGLVLIVILIVLGVLALILSMIYAEKLNLLFDSFIKKIKGKYEKTKQD